jgi:Holliday junction resolvase RusA-like endonuclease
MKVENRLYADEFGHIPDDKAGRIAFILGKKKDSKPLNEEILKEAKKWEMSKWEKVSFTMYRIMRPSARPRGRYVGYVKMHVPRAKSDGDWFNEFAKDKDFPFVTTPCILNMIIYEKTPSSFNLKNKVLAELGLIRPWTNRGDFDNYAKGVADMMTRREDRPNGMLRDDCLVITGHQDLFYSIKPRCDVEVIFMKPTKLLTGLLAALRPKSPKSTTR